MIIEVVMSCYKTLYLYHKSFINLIYIALYKVLNTSIIIEINNVTIKKILFICSYMLKIYLLIHVIAGTQVQKHWVKKIKHYPTYMCLYCISHIRINILYIPRIWPMCWLFGSWVQCHYEHHCSCHVHHPLRLLHSGLHFQEALVLVARPWWHGCGGLHMPWRLNNMCQAPVAGSPHSYGGTCNKI